MNVVEAIDAWIDENIDDLSDDELEVILQILDVVSASDVAYVEISQIYDDDVASLVTEVGGDKTLQVRCETVLREALFADSVVEEPEQATPPTDAHLLPNDYETTTNDDLVATVEEHAPTSVEVTAEEVLGVAPDQKRDTDKLLEEEPELVTNSDSTDDEPEPEPLSDAALQIESEPETEPDAALETEPDPHEPGPEHAGLTDPSSLSTASTETPEPVTAKNDDHSNFLSDIANATAAGAAARQTVAATPTVSLPALEPTLTLPVTQPAIDPVPLRVGDELGPSFLTDVSVTRRPSKGRLRYVAFSVFMIAGLAAFGFGMAQLLDSLNDEPAEELATASEPATDEEEPTVAPTAAAVPTGTAVPLDPSAPAPTPTPPPPPPPRLAVRLSDGSVTVATYETAGQPPVFTQVYDAGDDDLEPAANVIWLDDKLGVVDTDGNILLVDPTDRRPDPKAVYEASGGLAPALEIEPVPGRIAVRTDEGDITLISRNGRADPDTIEFVWDAESEETAATDISSVSDIIPFSLESGDARMIVTSSDNAIVTLWLAREQPKVFNVDASSTGILMGVGQGGVARYRLGDVEGSRIEAVWDPFTTDEAPAIGYGAAGDRTAIVLGDGAIVLADETGNGPRIWDPADTELRAFSAIGTDSQAVVLLETGSVVRIPFSPDEQIESVWDITDETLAPAVQIAIEGR